MNRLKISKLLPLFLVIAVVVIIAFQNIIPNTYFSGWDNFHPEFNLLLAFKRAFFGAWVTFQGTGAPASQSQIADLTRLPFIFILKLFLPDNLVRYAFHFLMVLIGGIGIYFYLQKIWLTKVNDKFRDWIASLGGIFYVLNITTLQQFYISFEDFAVEFAFLPFAFMSIHELSRNVNAKTILKFILIQLLIAPYAFVATNFYFCASFFVIYGFFVNLQIQRNLVKTIKKTLFLTFLILFINSYWLLPNVYYIFHNAHYVQESRANQLFDLEALWSVREAASIPNLLTGMHFIFNWKHFNFKIFQHEYNYTPWGPHLSNQLTLLLLTTFTLLSFVGFLKLIFDREKGYKRWGFMIIFLITAILIWMGLFIPTKIFNFMYSFGIIQNSIRNLYTKLSTIYSFELTILLCLCFESIINYLKNNKNRLISTILPFVILCVSFISIIFISWPSFTGNYIDNILKIDYPAEYFEMFSYLKTKPSNLRVLELPFLSSDGWILYDWTTLNKREGYQGMGFYYFGMPQALITPDFTRWTETTDFFYHELKHAMNSQNTQQLSSLLDKYNVSLVIVDETVIRNYMKDDDYSKNHQMLTDIGYKKVWNKNFLSIYEKVNQHKKEELIIPSQISFINADTARVRRDYVYENIGGYINTNESKADILFPFINLTSPYIHDAVFQNDKASIERKVPPGNYSIIIPGIKDQNYSTVAQIIYKDNRVSIIFPETNIFVDSKQIGLPQFNNIDAITDQEFDSVIVWFNNQQFQIHKNQTIYPILISQIDEPLQVSMQGINNAEDNSDELSYNIPITIYQPHWELWRQDIVVKESDIKKIKLETRFPIISADLKKNPSDNCNNPKFGKTTITYNKKSVVYSAADYGVNCSYYNFDYFTPNYPYLLQISGKNDSGRSLKFYINYNYQNSVPEEYLMPKNEYTTTLGLIPVATNAQSSYAINWETRSYGKEDKNELSSITYIPFPLDRLSQIQLQKNDVFHPLENDVSRSTVKSFSNFLFFINADCKNKPCFIGIDQAYDDLWLAFGKNFRILPHYRYNNWANIWQIDNSQNITVVYIPEIISLASMFFLVIAILLLIKKNIKPLQNN